MKPIARNAMSPLWETKDRFEPGAGPSPESNQFFDQYLAASKTADSDGPIICRLSEKCSPSQESQPVVEKAGAQSDPVANDEPDSSTEAHGSDRTTLGGNETSSALSEEHESDVDGADSVADVGTTSADGTTAVLNLDVSASDDVADIEGADEWGKGPLIGASDVPVDESQAFPDSTESKAVRATASEMKATHKTAGSGLEGVGDASAAELNHSSESDPHIEAMPPVELEGVESPPPSGETIEGMEVERGADPKSLSNELAPSSSFEDASDHRHPGSQDAEAEGEALFTGDYDEPLSSGTVDAVDPVAETKPAGPSSRVTESMVPVTAESSVAPDVADEGQQTASVEQESFKFNDKLTPTVESSSASGESAIEEATPRAAESRHHVRLNSMQQQRMLQRVTKAFELAQQRGGEIRLRLSPPALGSLKVELKFEGQQMSARLEAEHSQARQLIMEHLPALRDRLAEQGITIETFDVDLYHDSSGDAQYADQESMGDDSQGRYSGSTVTEANSESNASEQVEVVEDRSLNVVV